MDSNQIMIESFKTSHPKTEFHKPDSLCEAVQFLSNIDSEIINESSITELSKNKYYIEANIKKVTESLEKDNKFVWPYYIAPYFTEEEASNLSGYYHENTLGDSYNPKSVYKKTKELEDRLRATEDPDEIGEIKAQLDALGQWSGEANEFYDEVCSSSSSSSSKSANGFEPKSWSKKITELMNQLKLEEDPDEIDKIKQELVDLGWNPEVDFTAENQILAKNRIEKIYQEKYCKSLVLDVSSFIESSNLSDIDIIEEGKKSKAKPIHIVLIRGNGILSPTISKVDKGPFSHSAISIDNDFNKLYSFNMNNKKNKQGGFSVESVEEYPKDNRLAIFSFFVSEETHTKIKEKIEILANNVKHTSYSILNLLLYPFKKINLNLSNSMICSQFVDSILKLANIDLTKKNSSKVTPNDFYRFSMQDTKIYKLFDGINKDFNAKKTERYMARMASKAVPLTESTNFSLLEEYLYPVIIETKMPIQFNKDGDMIINNNFVDFDAEYSSSHKLLIEYAKNNNLDGIKYELARLYYINYILEKKLYHNKFLKNKEKNIKTRARVLNDFKKYLNLVLKQEPNFNFADYYEQTIFYPHTVTVNSSTMVKLKDIINYIL